jgi:hypothetical protein
MVGKSGYGQNSVGDNFGRLLVITIDDEQWLSSQETSSSSDSTCSSTLDSGVTDGLANSGFDDPSFGSLRDRGESQGMNHFVP